MIRVGLLVPGKVLRRGLEEVLRELPSIEVTGSAGWLPAEELLRDVDVLIVGGSETDGETLVESLPDPARPPAVLLLSDDPAAAGGWLDLPLRAFGALPSAVDEDELAAAIAALGRGLSVWHPALFSSLQSRPAEPLASPVKLPDEIEALTERELEVLQLMALGLANKKIALDLAISEHTVKFHISSIYGKLGAGNRTEAVRIGLQTGLISL
jgi:DNA-binding NarL/FixJ family response regulator